MNNHLFLKSGRFHHKLLVAEIVYAEAEGKYIRVYTTGKNYFIRGSFAWLLDLFGKHEQFCRIHKSYIVSLSHITSYTTGTVMMADRKLPVGRHYKAELQRLLASTGVKQPGREKKVAAITAKVNSLLNQLGSQTIPGNSFS